MDLACFSVRLPLCAFSVFRVTADLITRVDSYVSDKHHRFDIWSASDALTPSSPRQTENARENMYTHRQSDPEATGAAARTHAESEHGAPAQLRQTRQTGE